MGLDDISAPSFGAGLGTAAADAEQPLSLPFRALGIQKARAGLTPVRLVRAWNIAT